MLKPAKVEAGVDDAEVKPPKKEGIVGAVEDVDDDDDPDVEDEPIMDGGTVGLPKGFAKALAVEDDDAVGKPKVGVDVLVVEPKIEVEVEGVDDDV